MGMCMLEWTRVNRFKLFSITTCCGFNNLLCYLEYMGGWVGHPVCWISLPFWLKIPRHTAISTFHLLRVLVGWSSARCTGWFVDQVCTLRIFEIGLVCPLTLWLTFSLDSRPGDASLFWLVAFVRCNLLGTLTSLPLLLASTVHGWRLYWAGILSDE